MSATNSGMPLTHVDKAPSDPALTAGDGALADTGPPRPCSLLTRQIRMLTEFLNMAQAFALKDHDAFDEHLDAAVEQMPEMEQALRMTATAAIGALSEAPHEELGREVECDGHQD